MLGEEQAEAYAQADFEEPHRRVVELFDELFPDPISGYVLDVGCGAADIAIRFARAHPNCTVHGVDGSEAMLKVGSRAIFRADLADRIQLFQAYLPSRNLPRRKYDAVISNSLLHHLRDPGVLWEQIRQYARVGAPVLIVDLMRPNSKAQARKLVKAHTEGEAPILRRDFYNSLLASYRPEEIRRQLEKAGLDFKIREISDRHLAVYGRR